MSSIASIKAYSEKTDRFVNSNIDYFFTALIPVLPIFIIYHLPNELTYPLGIAFLFLIRILWFYGWSCLAVSWLRAIVKGPNKAYIVSPLKPDVSTCIFTVMLFITSFAINALPEFSTYSIMNLNKIMNIAPAAKMLSIIVYILCVYCLVRLSLLFIAKAEGTKMSFLSSLERTKNKEPEMILSGVTTAFPYLIALSLYILFVGFFENSVLDMPEGTTKNITNQILKAPADLILTPLITMIILTPAAHLYLEKK